MISRLTVEGEQPNPLAIAWNTRSAAKPREISSRSANDNRRSARDTESINAGRTRIAEDDGTLLGTIAVDSISEPGLWN